MLRATASLAAILCLAFVAGCGGGGSSGGGSSQSAFVHILDTSLNPRSVSVNVGVPVHWVNSTGQPQQVVSGVLAPQPTGAPATIIRITGGGLFNPPSTPSNPVQVNLGDTVEFSNDSAVAQTVSVFNDNNVLVFTVPLAQGQLADVTNQFLNTGAGLYTFNLGGVGQSGAIVLFGRPVPDTISVNSFQSPALASGSTFTRVFTQAGLVRYYSPDINNPNRSFRTGTITIP